MCRLGGKRVDLVECLDEGNSPPLIYNRLPQVTRAKRTEWGGQRSLFLAWLRQAFVQKPQSWSTTTISYGGVFGLEAGRRSKLAMALICGGERRIIVRPAMFFLRRSGAVPQILP